MHLTLVPAYGRDYKSKKAVVVDWNADKDFLVMPECRYTNKSNTETLYPGCSVNIRYNNMRSVAVLTVK